jgi:hypothetical protein
MAKGSREQRYQQRCELQLMLIFGIEGMEFGVEIEDRFEMLTKAIWARTSRAHACAAI